MTEQPAVAVEDLTRRYAARRGGDDVLALDRVSLTVEPGQVHGLLGPNGAGKTTLVKILATVLLPTSGRALVAGHDVVAEVERVRPLIGIVFGGERGLYPRLTARQNLAYWAALYRVPGGEARARVGRLLDRVGLGERADDRVETYSRGMKQRLHLARGLVGDPAVLFLDEPTTGLDPVAAREFRGLVQELQREGRTILLTTHDMVEAEAICDVVSFIDRGRLLGTDSPRVVGRWVSQFERVDAEGVPADLLPRLRAVPGVGTVEDLGGGAVRVTVVEAGATRPVLGVLVEAGVTSIRTSLPTLEDVYLNLIGQRGLQV